MTFDEFGRTSTDREIRVFGTAYQFELWYYVLGLTGEVGEIAERVRTRQSHDAIMYELGDVIWYVNAIAMKLGRNLEDVARMNGEKLDDRERRGAFKPLVSADPSATPTSSA
jgi:NTP pyrophosphatase (non-canonical NTP hydrolase)